MRVLFLTERYPPQLLGGYELACHAVAEGLCRRGHEALVVTSRFGVSRPIRNGQVRRVLHQPKDSPDLATLGVWEALDRRALVRSAARFRPDVVYAWCLLSLFPSLHRTVRELGVPIVTNLQDLWIPAHLAMSDASRQAWQKRPRGFLRRVAKGIVEAGLRASLPDWDRPLHLSELDLGHLVFCSRFRQMQHLAQGLPAGESRVIYNGIDLGLFSPSPDAPTGTEPPLRILFVGRLAAEKGVHTLLAALAVLAAGGRHDMLLSVIGVPSYPWEYAIELRQWVAAEGLGSRVQFLSPVSQAELPQLYRAHDVLVFPSTGDEGLPVTLLEALGCGLPVISTATGGSAEIVEDGRTALVFKPGDERGLAERLSRLADAPLLRRALAAAGRAEAEARFDINAICAETESYLAGLCRAGGGSALPPG
jgi:glycogen(starch) synthase